MGGCRCVYRTCLSSTTLSPGLHYFHFPIRDPDRCEQWITNARKPMLRAIPREKLRNKVICSLHFEERCFTNEKHDRLVHNAIPTLGFDDAPEDYVSFANQSEEVKDDNNIMLIPINEDNTKFTLSDVSFPGMSYTILDDAVIPTSNLPLLINQMESKQNKISIVVKKHGNEVERKPKRPKFTVTSVNKIISPNVLKTLKQEPQNIKDEVNESVVEYDNSNNIMSYSVSTCGDDVMVELTKQPKEMNNETICTFSIDNQSKSDAPLLDNDISLKFKSSNEYTMSVLPPPPLVRIQQNNNEGSPVKNELTQFDDTSQDNEQVIESNDFENTREKEYIRMIKDNSKQIVQLKKLVNKQNRLHKYMLQRKQLRKYKKKSCDKVRLLDNLKNYVKPSLMAILKFEILPSEDVVLTDSEEKFITDLYMENPECYNLLLKKYKWKLPNSENFSAENGN